MLLDPTVARLKAEVAGLGGRIDGALQLSDLTRKNALPQQTPAAFVVSLGLRGGEADVASGAFTQIITRIIGVVLFIRDNTPDGRHAIDAFEALENDIVSAIAGWAPADQIGVFRLISSRALAESAGTKIHQIEFSITDQLRIFP